MNMVNLLPGNVQNKIQIDFSNFTKVNKINSKQNKKLKILMESLILAQDERWRHA